MTKAKADGRHSLRYEGREIGYELRRSRRKTLGIQVRPDGSVRVMAPAGASLPAIEEVLQRKAHWIVRKQAEVAAFREAVVPLRFVEGEPHRFLGREYCLRIETGSAADAADTGPVGKRSLNKEAVTLEGPYLRVRTVGAADAQAVARLLEGWYRQQAQTVFQEVLVAARERVLALGIVAPPSVRIRRMKTRWGSCTAKGVITLNLRLIQVQREMIEYVLVHELCHLREHNHSPAYFRLLDRALPEWREWKRRLNSTPIA
jgi:predicted metal-dependent hydrolase